MEPVMTLNEIHVPVRVRSHVVLFAHLFTIAAMLTLVIGVHPLQAAELPSLDTIESFHPSIDEMPKESGDVYTWSGAVNKKHSREYVVKAYDNMIMRRTTSAWKREPKPQYKTGIESASVGIEIQAVEDPTKIMTNFRKNFEENPHYEKFRNEPFGDKGYRYRRTTAQDYTGPTTTVLFIKGNIFVMVTAYTSNRITHDELAKNFATIVLNKIPQYN